MSLLDNVILVDGRVREKRPLTVATKLHFPKSRSSLVDRPHLIKQLNACLRGQLTIVSAPAGFGKTTLVAEWIKAVRNEKNRFTWVSLDHNDNDLVRFLIYFISGLQKIEADLGETAMDWLKSTTESPTEAVLTAVINDIVEVPYDTTIILDDFHLITEPAIHQAFTFLLDNQPPNLHLIIISRADPPWPLARLRARRELCEIRARDLRFSIEETAVFLNTIKQLDISREDVVALDKQTEGWIAGIQMAALSMHNQGNAADFIKNFSASHSFILDYLVEEVLEIQPPHIQTFLLQTSILVRMSAPLCDEITGNHNSDFILNQLDQTNLFLIPLDDERHWYRYHHLFADVLRNRLEKLHPDLLPELHLRASKWHAQFKLYDEAVSHALASNNLEWATDCIEQAAFEAIRSNREVTLSNWLKALPVEEIKKRPWLCVAQAYIHQWLGQRDRVEKWLQCAAKKARNKSPLIRSPSENRRLSGYIASMRAHNALVSGDVQTVVTQAKRALESLPDDDSWRMASQVALGGAYWALGDIKAAEKTFVLASTDGKKLGDRLVQVSAGCYAGIQQEKQGKLHTAFNTFQELEKAAVRSGGRPMPIAGMPMIRIGDLLREWNTLTQAKEVMDEGVDLCVQMSQPDILCEAYINQARLCLALADTKNAQAAIERAEAVMATTPVDLWLTCWLDECRLRYWLTTDQMETAVYWANNSGLTIDGELNYHCDLHHINLARVLVAQGIQEPSEPYLGKAQTLLTRLLTAAEKAGWVHESIKILILQTLALQAAGEAAGATAVLDRALTLAEPGEYIRLFIDEGDPMHQLLSKMERSIYVCRLLAAMEGGGEAMPVLPSSDLVDPLSPRELDVLHLLNTYLSSVEIAAELSIAPSTVRSHIKNIYSKLNTHSRTEAILRAEELNLI